MVKFDNVTAWLELVMFMTVVFLPAILIILTRFKLSRLGWFGLYLLSLPVWQFILPLYAFWHFDDFSWGSTRKVEGAGETLKTKALDASNVPLRRWEDYERAWRKSLKKKRSAHISNNAPISAPAPLVFAEQNDRRESIVPQGGFPAVDVQMDDNAGNFDGDSSETTGSV